MATADPRPHLMAPLLARPERGAILTDYDGTLSPIVDDPFGADPLPGASDVLARLATRFGRVGVVSGRPAAFLLRHFGGRGLFLSGLYGLEQVVGDGVVVNDDAVEWAPTVEEVAARTEAHGPSGLFVERKGLSVTLHYRTDPGREEAVRSWAEAEAARTGLVVHVARMSYELRPPVSRDKGTVVAEAAAGMGAVCFVGDDRGDLAAFDVLEGLAADGVHSVKVGVRSDEAPAELLVRADLLVDGPAGALALLEGLLA